MPAFLGDHLPSIVMLQDKTESEVEAYLKRRYESYVANIEIVDKEDLALVSGSQDFKLLLIH